MEKQTLQQQVFEYVKQTADKIGDFAVKEIPPVIHEYLNWKFWEAGIGVAVWVLFLTICLFIVGTWWKKDKYNIKRNEDHAMPFVFFTGTVIVVLILSFLSVYDNILDMIQIKIAPKVYLIEKASEIIKG